MSTTPSSPTSTQTSLAPLESEGFVRELAQVLADNKAANIKALRMLELVEYCDWFLICEARSDRHARAIYEDVKSRMMDKKTKPLSSEGADKGHWIVMDYASVVVHIFYEPTREVYELEKLWADAPELTLEGIESPDGPSYL